MKKPLVGCRHLDFEEGKYTDCKIKNCSPHFPEVRYWERGERWTEGDRNPQNVQFCGEGRGRINGIFQCYNPGEMPCYSPPELKEEKIGE